MPTVYKKKGNCNRASWTEGQLQAAVNAIKNEGLGVNEASRKFCVPQPTLRRRMRSNILKKLPLGPSSVMGCENELKIKNHVIKLQKAGFTPTRQSIRKMAFRLAENLKIKHRFNKETGMAGYDWLQSFLRRNRDLSVGKSLARSQDKNLKDVVKYFELLERTILENQVMEMPDHIFNMDEIGLQLNNKASFVLAAEGPNNVADVNFSEKGETITIICCCNAEGNFLPPCCIFERNNKKEEFEVNMPHGSKFYMNEKSASISTDIFIDWLKTHFVPRKPPGKVILILDGHSCHCNSVEMLEYADQNEIILICLPSHTKQFLQPLGRSFFKSLKSHFYIARNSLLRMNSKTEINRLTFGKLLTEAWMKSANVQNGVSGFRECGIYPFNMDVIPNYAYLQATSVEECTIPLADLPVNSNANNQHQPSSMAIKTEEESEIIPNVTQDIE